MRQHLRTLAGPGLLVLWALGTQGCTESNQTPISAIDLKTGERREFGSSADVPAGWQPCSDPTCGTVPPGVPCQNLGPKVCSLNPNCRVKTLSCVESGCAEPGTGTGTGSSGSGSAGSGSGSVPPASGGGGSTPGATPSGSGNSTPGGLPTNPTEPPNPGPAPAPGGGCGPSTPPVCELACVPKFPLECEELTGEKACTGRKDCEWGAFYCPMCMPQEGTGCECKPSCRQKAPPTCDALDETTCGKRPDCEWLPGVCPMCEPQNPNDPAATACTCRSFCQAKPLQCTVAISPPAPDFCPNGKIVPKHDARGCVVGFSCEKYCPALAPLPPDFCVGGKIQTKYDPRGCAIGFECIKPTDPGTCADLSKAYGIALDQARSCAPSAAAKQCSLQVPDRLACACVTYVNAGQTAAVQKLNDLRKKWDAAGCNKNLACPAVACFAPQAASCDAASGKCKDATK